jgi:hypothetical protein
MGRSAGQGRVGLNRTDVDTKYLKNREKNMRKEKQRKEKRRKNMKKFDNTEEEKETKISKALCCTVRT